MEHHWITSCFPRDFVGYCVEVGAYDGQEGSITLALEHAGWYGLAVEPNPDLEISIKDHRERYWMGACSDFTGEAEFHIYKPTPAGFSSLKPVTTHPTWHPTENDWEIVTVQVDTLDRLLDRFEFPQIDAVSIDTESTELDVLRGFDLDRWKPKCLVIESWDVDGPVIPYLKERGYKRVDRHIVTDLFLRVDA